MPNIWMSKPPSRLATKDFGVTLTLNCFLSQIAGRVNDYLTWQPAGHNVWVTIKVWRGVWFTGGTPVLLSLTHFKTLTRLPALSLLLFP